MASSFQFMSQRSQWDGECDHLQNRDGAQSGLSPRKYKSTLNAMPLSLPFCLWKDHLAITHLDTDSAPSRCIIVERGSEKSLARSSCCVTWAVSASETCPVHPCHQDLQLLSHQWHCEIQYAEAALQCLWRRQSVTDTQAFLSPKDSSLWLSSLLVLKLGDLHLKGSFSLQRERGLWSDSGSRSWNRPHRAPSITFLPKQLKKFPVLTVLPWIYHFFVWK